MRARRAATRAFASFAALALLAPPRIADAQQTRACGEPDAQLASRAIWVAPLDAPISLRLRAVSLRDALDRVGALSGIPLAYSSDLLPLDRQVCVSAEGQPLGQVLATLLADTRVQALVVAGHVVLAPVNGPRDPESSKVSVLERVIVTGNAVAAPRRPLTVGVEVIDGDRLRRENYPSLSAALDAAVPGLWVWDQTPGSVVAQYGGVRGASSFQASYPKMYIDGVEVANPLLVTQLDPDVVDRVEIIRGPQGSALYGSDAISGVINVITRHDGATSAGSRIQVSSMAGAGASAFGTSLVPTHDQRVSVRTGTNLRSAGLALEFGQTGAVFPSSESRQLTVVGDGRIVTSGATINASARFFDRRSGAGQNPLLLTSTTTNGSTSGSTSSGNGGAVAKMPYATPSTAPQAVQLYTSSTSATFAPHGIWTNSLLAGVDGYQMANVADASNPSATQPDLGASSGRGDRATFRASSVGQIGGTPLTPAATLTLSIEQSVLRQLSDIEKPEPTQYGQRYAATTLQTAERWNHNTGALAQASTSWRDALYLTGGLRVEQNDAFSGDDRHPLLPLLGAAVVHSFGGAEVKLRSSFGRGIRPVVSPVRGAWDNDEGAMSAAAKLDPEVQTGIESGLELYFGHALSFQATRFDQRATGLIQNVAVAVDTQLRGGAPERRLRFEPENVGEITNRGWELQGNLQRGPLALAGTFSTVDSRVRSVARTYGGDLRAGDRMLGVPAQTASLVASWTMATWSTSLTATRAADWINYDRVALSRGRMTSDDGAERELSGDYLRSFWRPYSGETHLRLVTSRDVGRGLTLVLSGDNLLGGQVGEPDNLTIRQGRTLTGGVHAAF